MFYHLFMSSLLAEKVVAQLASRFRAQWQARQLERMCTAPREPGQYRPAPPTAASFSVWRRARDLALDYWALLAGDARLSAPLRALCARCLETLRELSVRGI